MTDRRDGITWVALELSPYGEQAAEDGTLEDVLRRYLGVGSDWPVFIPSKIYDRKGKRTTVHLLEGYAFVASGLDEIVYFRLESTKLVEQVLAARGERGMRILTTIPDQDITELRRQLGAEVAADVVVGMHVRVTDGVYRGIEGIVLDMEGDYAVVRFELRSLKVISKVPKIFLDTPA